MQRPSLNPSVLLEAAAEGPPPTRPSRWRVVFRAAAAVVAFLLMPVGPRREAEGRPERPLLSRVLHGLIYRLAALPVLLAVIVSVLVYTATHPVPVPALADPSAVGLYFEKVTVRANDGVVSEAWLVPVVDARRVIEEREWVLRSSQPAMVLVHDHAFSRQQLLPYLRPLHEAGIVTLTLATRGIDTQRPSGRTFGLRESLDVAAAVALLRQRAMVDGDRVGLLGIGTGATAALLAARHDPRIRVIAAIDPPRTPDEALRPLTPTQPMLRFLEPLSRITFETLFNVNTSDADLSRLSTSLRDRQVLYVLSDGGRPTNETSFRTVTHFVASRLADETAHPSATAPQTPGERALLAVRQAAFPSVLVLR